MVQAIETHQVARSADERSIAPDIRSCKTACAGMPGKATQTDATTVTFEVSQLFEALSLTAEQVRRDPVYVRIPTSGVVPHPPQLFGPQIDGGQMPPQLIEWNQAEMTRLMGLQMEPAQTIDDALPAQTTESVISEGYVCEKIYAEPVRGLAYEY